MAAVQSCPALISAPATAPGKGTAAPRPTTISRARFEEKVLKQFNGNRAAAERDLAEKGLTVRY